MKHFIARHIILSIALCTAADAAALHASPGASDSVVQPYVATGALLDYTGLYTSASIPFLNPALMPRRQPFSLCRAAVSYRSDLMNAPVIAQQGRGTQQASFDAEAYMLLRHSAVWGNASYTNGRIVGMKLCESPDWRIVAPYTIADTIGGNQKMEHYRFGAGYGAAGRIVDWGIAISYDAGLYYRQTDPRPKSITGLLDIRLGAAFHAGRYLIGPGACFQRYRQSTDISFMSEMGESKLYHTTGLGTHYSRFDGSGSNVFSDMFTYTLSADIFPAADRGWFAAARFTLSSMRHVIRDLNKLPMAGLTDKKCQIQLGYMHLEGSLRWKAFADFAASHRHGRENLFGDPSSGSYPEIGSRLAYADNSWQIRCAADVVALNGKWQFSAAPSIAYSHSLIATAEPHRKQFADLLCASLRLSAARTLGSRWSAAAAVGASYGYSPKSYLTGISSSGNAADRADFLFNKAATDNFRNLTAVRRSISASMRLQYSFSARYALALAAGYNHTGYSSGLLGNAADVSLQFLF